MDCPRRSAAKLYRRMVVDAGYELRDTGEHIGAVTGTGCHAGAAYMLGQKITTATLGNASECEDISVEALRKEAREGVIYDAITGDMNTAEKQVRRQVAMYRQTVAPAVSPVAVEEELPDARMEVQGAYGVLEVTLTGHADCREEDTPRIRDLKTGGKPRWNAAQYGHYSLMARGAGYEVDELIEDFLPRVSIRKPQPPVEPREHDPGAAEQMAVRVIQQIARDVEQFEHTGERWAFPVNPMSMLCSPKFCPAWGTSFCREHAPET